MGGGKPVHEGWLTKSPPQTGSGLKRWKKRWVVLLQSNMLEYYEDEKRSKLKGSVNLEDCTSISTDLTVHKSKGKHMFLVETPSRKYFFCTASKNDETEWVAKLTEQCNFPVTAVTRSFTLSPAGKSPASRGSGGRGTATLPSGGKVRAQTMNVLNSPSSGMSSLGTPSPDQPKLISTTSAAAVNAAGAQPVAPGSDYFLVGEPTHNAVDGGAATAVPGVAAGPLQNGSMATDRLSQRVHSIHLGREMTEQEATALESYDFVPPPVNGSAARRTSQQSLYRNGGGGGGRPSLSHDMALSAPDERYVDLPKALSAAVAVPLPGPPPPGMAQSQYQYPPPPRLALNATRSVPESAIPVNVSPPEDPQSNYSYPPAPRPLSPPLSGERLAARPGQYAVLGPDDWNSTGPPPSIDRTSKPKTEADGASPGAPSVNRGSKPLLKQYSTASGGFELDGLEFEQAIVSTVGSKRFSKYGVSDIVATPPPVSPMTAELMAQCQVNGIPMVSSHFSQEDVAMMATCNYDIPPNLRLPGAHVQAGSQVFQVLPADHAALLNGQLVMAPMPGPMYGFDMLQGSNQHYSVPPNLNQHYDFPPNPSEHYSVPPNPNQHYTSPPNPSQHYDYPPGTSRTTSMMMPSQHYDYPPGLHSRGGSQRLSSSSSAGNARVPSPPGSNYSIPPAPQPLRAVSSMPPPTSDYSYPPHPIRASPHSSSAPDPDTAYSIPPAPIPVTTADAAAAAPARPSKPVALAAGKLAPAPQQFNPADYGAGGVAMAAVDGDQEYMVMTHDPTAATMDEQYIDMTQLGKEATNGVLSVGDQVIAMRTGGTAVLPPRPPKP